MIFIFGVTTFDGDDEDELLDEIFTGVVEPDTLDGDLELDEVLLE